MDEFQLHLLDEEIKYGKRLTQGIKELYSMESAIVGSHLLILETMLNLSLQSVSCVKWTALFAARKERFSVVLVHYTK